MSNFPLYTTLNNKIKDKDLTILQKKQLVDKIQLMDSEAHNLIYALIKSYYLDNNIIENLSVPYSGTISNEKINFNLIDLPNKLKQILYKFILLHSEKIHENEDITKYYNNVESI